MRRVAITITALTLALYLGARGERLTPGDVRVVDGDTVAIGDGYVRLRGIDAAEIRSVECVAQVRAGRRARDMLRDFIDAGSEIEIEREGVDFYGRSIGDIIVDGRSAADYLIDKGAAKPWDGKGKRPSWC